MNEARLQHRKNILIFGANMSLQKKRTFPRKIFFHGDM